MGPQIAHTSPWELAEIQHGVITREQLLAFGLSRDAIRHRVARGRLHPLWPRTYVIGRRGVSQEGRWLAAVLTCGRGGALSHASAAALWGITPPRDGPIEVSVPYPRSPRRRGIKVHRRREYATTEREHIPVTTPAQTIIDLAARVPERALERAINEADKLDLLHPAQLRVAADGQPGAGAKRVRDLLDRQTLFLTDSELERRFIPLARRAGLPEPEPQASVNGFKVDFWWPSLRLVVETDGGRYHRTASQQTRDRLRDQTHLAAGLTPLRFTHAQIAFDPDHVVRTLVGVAAQSP
jgi:very-short-patch-repair endonuclease